MARMAQLHLDGLVEMTHDNAKCGSTPALTGACMPQGQPA